MNEITDIGAISRLNQVARYMYTHVIIKMRNNGSYRVKHTEYD